MKQSITFSQFVDAFHAHDRYDSFGYDGLRIIFDYVERYEQACDTEIELDVIAICCEYSMMTVEDIINAYSLDVSGIDADDVEEYVIDYLDDNTTVLGRCADGVVFQCF